MQRRSVKYLKRKLHVEADKENNLKGEILKTLVRFEALL